MEQRLFFTMSIKHTMIAGLVLQPLLITSAWAGLNLVQLQSLAEKQNPDLLLSQQEVTAAGLATSLQPVLPNLTISGQLLGSGASQSGGAGQTKGAISVSQEFRFGTYGGHVRAARAALASSSASKQARQDGVTQALKQAFYRWQITHRSVQLHQSTVTLWTDLSALTQSKMSDGTVSEIDAREVRLNNLRAGLALSEEVSKRGEIEGDIALLVGRTTLGDTIEPVALDSLDVVPALDSLLKIAHANNAELIALTRAKTVRQAELDIERTLARPSLSISADYEREREGIDFYGAGIEVPLPLFDRNKPGIARARSAVERADLEYRNLALGLDAHVTSIHQTLTSIRNRISDYASVVRKEGAQQVALAEKGYRQGMLSVFDLSRIQDAYLGQETEHLQLLGQYYATRSELEHLIGRPLQ